MKALLMHRGRDFDVVGDMPGNERVLTQGLELDTLFHAMAGDDEFLLDIARKTLLSGLQNDMDTILYRQAILKDCLNNPSVVRPLYDLAMEAIKAKRKQRFGILGRYSGAIFHGSIELLEMFLGVLRKLRGIAEEQAGRFESEEFTAFYAMLEKELSEEYLASIQDHLKEPKFPDGVLMSAELGRGNEGTNYVLRKPRRKRQNWLKRLFEKGPSAYTFRLADRDEAGTRRHRFSGLYDACLALHMEREVVRNTVDVDRKSLVIITGANQGGNQASCAASV